MKLISHAGWCVCSAEMHVRRWCVCQNSHSKPVILPVYRAQYAVYILFCILISSISQSVAVLRELGAVVCAFWHVHKPCILMGLVSNRTFFFFCCQLKSAFAGGFWRRIRSKYIPTVLLEPKTALKKVQIWPNRANGVSFEWGE